MAKHSNIETSELIERYLSYKLVVQERSQKTVDEYRLDLRQFFRFLIAKRDGIPTDGEEYDNLSIEEVDGEFVKRITSRDVLEFLAFERNERDNQPSARARKLSAIKSFFKYLTVHEHITEKNVAADVESPKLKKALPKYLTEEESVELLRAVADDKSSRSRPRDYCMITLFLNCGMRLSELVGINFSDIARDLSSLRVVGKGNKERMIYLNDACKAAITDYLTVRGSDKTTVKDKNALFISNRGTRISNQMVQKTVEKYLSLAGLGNRNLSTHKLRHTAATLLYQQGGVSVLTLKEILGHEQLSTTQIYTHVSNKEVEQAAKLHPLANLTRKSVEGNGADNDDNDGED
ncbi:MAG: tyrosine recombinase XerC [Clostridia bacterium]|nr:tyrosine recombinase XerC [Clostridia bacterium]